MKKRQKKKMEIKSTPIEKETHSVPEEVLQKIKQAAEEAFFDLSDLPTIKINVLKFWDKEVIYVEARGGVVDDSFNSPNYFGNSMAEQILDSVPEVELIGFDCEYSAQIKFKMRA